MCPASCISNTRVFSTPKLKGGNNSGNHRFCQRAPRRCLGQEVDFSSITCRLFRQLFCFILNWLLLPFMKSWKSCIRKESLLQSPHLNLRCCYHFLLKYICTVKSLGQLFHFCFKLSQDNLLIYKIITFKKYKLSKKWIFWFINLYASCRQFLHTSSFLFLCICVQSVWKV